MIVIIEKHSVIRHKMLSTTLLSKLNQYVEDIIRDYQCCGFRRNIPILIILLYSEFLKYISQKEWEQDGTMYRLLTDLKERL